MRTLARFWSALDALPGAATHAQDWQARLGDEWQWTARFLRSTGKLAGAVDCPSPGGDGCPRTVIALPEGSFRAVCGCSPQRCDPLDLEPADIFILELDRARLLADLAAALEAPSVTAVAGRGSCVLPVGRHAVAAGVACPVVLVLPGPDTARAEDDLGLAGLASEPGVVLTPSGRTLPGGTVARLRAAGHQLLALSDALGITGSGQLQPVQALPVLLSTARERLLVRLAPEHRQPTWLMPPDAQWPQLTFRLTADETLTCSFRGSTRELDPDFFDMRQARSRKPTRSWVVLQALAMGSGRVPIDDPSQERKLQKRYQLLGRELVTAFGIQPSPIIWERSGRAYLAAFVISDERPLSLRRNFARPARRG